MIIDFSFSRLAVSVIVLFAVSASVTNTAEADHAIQSQNERNWQNSFSMDANGKLVRFISPHLWAGVIWSGKPLDLKSYKSNLSMTHMRKGLNICGPVDAKSIGNKVCGVKIEKNKCKDEIYVRVRNKKIQYFQINVESDFYKGGIGRCYDKREGEKTRHMREFSKFPIGYWKEGESYGNIRIVDLGSPDSRFGPPDSLNSLYSLCLTFQWEGNQGKGRGRYKYCPGIGNVYSVTLRKRRR